MTFPRLVVAGTNSGSGKTTVVMAILAALRSRGTRVQPFKVGPDYIDPGFHTAAAGRPCRNLDTMLLPRDGLLELFAHASGDADISVVEGVMGLFDGAGPLDERGSTAHLAKTLESPVVLVVNAKAMARSAAALVGGFVRFDRRVSVRGVILNGMGGPGHYALVREAIEAATGIPVLGYLPRRDDISLPERHLGLVPAAERRGLGDLSRRLASLAEEYLDVDGLVRIARSAPPLPAHADAIFGVPATPRRIRIAVARDEAFNFYYEDNLDILGHLGAEIVPFSPIRDEALPEGTSGIYIGGGFPEEHAAALASNAPLLRAIRDAAGRMPVLAECGGLMYLVERLEDRAGACHEMAGVFPGTTRMGSRLQAFGYCRGRLLRSALPGRKGAVLRGHLFHWSSYSGADDGLYSLKLEKNGATFPDGLSRGDAFASYLHIHFGTNRTPAVRFIDRALRSREPRRGVFSG
jgi:cobyrinic acid a,c-diamide synthase